MNYNPNFQITLQKQETFAVGNALLRAFFGIFMIIPYVFTSFLYSIWYTIIAFIEFFKIIFTGKISESYHNFCVDYFNFLFRAAVWSFGMRDLLPNTDLSFRDPLVNLEIKYQLEFSRLSLLFKMLILPIALIFHSFILLIYIFCASILSLLAFFSVVFTGNYPNFAFDYIRNLLVWIQYINAYVILPTNDYNFPSIVPEVYQNTKEETVN